MSFRKVTAIIHRNVLEDVEAVLQQAGSGGITVTKVKGYGEYADFYERDWLTTHVRVEIFTTAARADPLAQLIADTAHTGLAGDGIVAILPVERVIRIRTRATADEGEL